jgi:LysR family transcriptional activator of nhaA
MKLSLAGRKIWVNYHHLHCFFVVVNEGGLSRASRVLGVGQSALSIQMKQFEEAIGFSLFDRAHRKIIPNERGLMVHAYAREIFRLGGEMVEALLDRPTAGRTHVEIGALEMVPKHFTLELVRQAIAMGNCTVKVVSGKPEFLLSSLLEHRVDLLVSTFVPRAEGGKIQARRISRLPLWVVGAPKFLNLKANFPASLHRAPMVLPTEESGARQAFEDYCRKRDLVPELVVEAQDLMIQKLLAINGVGLAIAPEFAVAQYLAEGGLIQLGLLEDLEQEFYLVGAARKVRNPVASKLLRDFRL